MAALNKFKIWMAAKLGSILRREITPDEITIGPMQAASGTKQTLVEVTYQGIVYPIVYDKYPIDKLFGGLAAPFAVRGEYTTLAEALLAVESRYGIALAEDEVFPIAIGPGTRELALSITQESYEYSGVLRVPFKWTGEAVLEKPLHEWLLQDNANNTGVSTTPLDLGFTFISNTAGKWASVPSTAHMPFPAGAVLDKTGDYTLDFEIIVASVPTYMCLFTTHASRAGASGSIWWYGGICYEYGISSGMAKIPALVANVPQRITLSRTGQTTSMYIDGVLAQTYSGRNLDPLIGIHDGDSGSYQFPKTAGLRNIRYWQRGLEAAELDILHNKKPLHSVSFYNTLENTGTSRAPLSNEFSFVEFAGSVWGTPTSGGAAELGFVMNTDTNFTVDFELIANKLGVDIPGIIFNSVKSTYTGALGVLATLRSSTGTAHNNKPCMAGMGYTGPSNVNTPQLVDDTPTRITIRRVGTKYSWYVNTVKVWEYSTVNEPAVNWSVFGGTDVRSKLYIRNLSYYNQALTDNDLAKLFVPVVPKPDHQFMLEENTNNTGKLTVPMTMGFTYEEVQGRQWGVRTGKDAEALGAGVGFSFVHDAVLDFEVLLAPNDGYRMIFSPDHTVMNAPATMMMYANRMYHAYFGYSSLDDIMARPIVPVGVPVRITQRRKAGIVYVYMNGTLYMSYSFSPTKPYMAIGDTDGISNPMRAPNKIRAIQYWPRALSDSEFTQLLKNTI